MAIGTTACLVRAVIKASLFCNKPAQTSPPIVPMTRHSLTPAVITAFIAIMHAALIAAPTISAITRSPATPTNNDSVTVTASVQPSAGTTISQVQLTYGTGVVTTGTVFRETMNATQTATSWNGTGALNPWTVTALRAAGDVKQKFGNANHTAPIVLTNCTTNGTTQVTCASTAALWPGMSINGTNISAGTKVSSISNATTFILSTSATGSGSALSLTAAGVTLTNCTTTGGSANVSCASTTGLMVGMGITGTGIAPNPSVASITDATNFVLNANANTGATGLTLTGSECGLEFSSGSVNYTDTMVATTNSMDTGNASAGYVEFYVRTSDFISNNGWTMQILSSDGTTWNTRASESYAANTISLTNCTLNATTTVTCASTTGLATGMTVQGATLRLLNCGTTNTNATVNCADTTGLAVGMYLNGNGLPNAARVISIVPNTSFTMSANANATGTVSVLANYLNGNTTISSITNGTTFVLNAAPVYSGGGLALDATTINHGYALKHYDLTAGDRSSNMKLRFQFSGYVAANPARIPLCDIDDVIVVITASVAPNVITMFDDGAHGDGAAGDGVFGATIPSWPTGTTVTYTISATDNLGGTATSSSASYTVVTAVPSLAVTPSTQLSATGNAGGPFTPSGITYTVSNTGTGSMNWTASKTAGWLTLSANGGTLAAGVSTSVTASINSTNANNLTGGSYSDTVTFTNTSNGTGNTTRGVTLTAYGIPSAPVLPAVPAFARGTTETFSWAAVASAASYTLQISTTANFATVLSTQTVTNPRGSFINLTEGVTYYYRVLASSPAGSSTYSNVIAVIPDATAPSVAITSPATNSNTTVASITVSGTSSDALSGVAVVKVNNVPATTSNGFATWTATVPLGFGSNGITATATDNAGNFTTTAPVVVTLTVAQTYNPLYIPDTMTGTTFNLTLDQSAKQYFTGAATQTYGYNKALFWGPTLIMKKGDLVQVHLKNNLIDTTTTHWHGFHIPSIMDGGPRQTIPAGTTWSPSFYVKNNAATYWYHPHLHTTTQQQVTMGGGGLIIVQDDEEAALPLPRTYGVDDIPLVLTSRRFVGQGAGANQFALNGAFGDFMLVNGTLNPQVNLPAQVVRLRILDGEVARNHNLGFSDNRTFYVIATDGGLLNAPVPVTRMVMGNAERYEILVDLRDLAPGSSLDLMTYNSNQPAGYSGGQVGTTGANGSLLNNIDFVDVHINIVATTANPITSIPTTLAHNVYWTSADVTNNRTVNLTGVGGAPLSFDNLVYSPSLINQTVNFNTVEQWTLANVSNLAHTFHIHDIQFYLTSVPGGVPAYMQGWKDSFIIPQLSSVSFITKFDDFASNTNPFMFHCHFLQHEDGGLMGQFLVQNNAVEDLAVASFARNGTNPAIALQFKATPGTTYTLQYSPNMTIGSWTDVGSVTSDGASASFNETDPTRLGQARGFYRIAMPVVSQ